MRSLEAWLSCSPLLIRPILGPTGLGQTAFLNRVLSVRLSKVELYLEKDFFSHGQLYVAMSRVGNPNNLSMLSRSGQFINVAGTYTDNVVFHEIL